MAHCPYDKLDDLAWLLGELRKIEGLKEPKPGIFYLKSQGFLHFHIDKTDKRWADVRDGKDWGKPIDTPFGFKKSAQTAFLSEVRKRLERCLAKR